MGDLVRLVWEVYMRDLYGRICMGDYYGRLLWEITMGDYYGRCVWGDVCGSERLGERL